jgi:hypothetical protein
VGYGAKTAPSADCTNRSSWRSYSTACRRSVPGGRFWETEPSSAERRKLLATLFDRIWQDEGLIVAVKPRPPFVRYFKTAERLNRQRTNRRGVNSGSDGTRTRDLRRDRPAF